MTTRVWVCVPVVVDAYRVKGVVCVLCSIVDGLWQVLPKNYEFRCYIRTKFVWPTPMPDSNQLCEIWAILYTAAQYSNIIVSPPSRTNQLLLAHFPHALCNCNCFVYHVYIVYYTIVQSKYDTRLARGSQIVRNEPQASVSETCAREFAWVVWRVYKTL